MTKEESLKVREIAQELSIAMPRVARKISFDFFKAVTIPQTQFFTMLILSEKGPCRISEICQDLDITAPTATGIINRLEKSLYVKRIVDKKDRRAAIISLTSKGEKVLTKLKHIIENEWFYILSKLTPPDRTNYIKIVRKIQRII